MPVSQIIFIRHAEEHNEAGLTPEGTHDDRSLTVRGWQRAGALAGFFTTKWWRDESQASSMRHVLRREVSRNGPGKPLLP